MLADTAYCEKCGNIRECIYLEEYHCDCCGNFPFKPVPEEYFENFRWRDGDGKEALMRELVEKSPKFDRYYYENRDQILNEQSKRAYEMWDRVRTRMQNNSSNIPKCPICSSTNLKKISTAGKVAKIGLFGIFGADDLGKTWKCGNCGSKF